MRLVRLYRKSGHQPGHSLQVVDNGADIREAQPPGPFLCIDNGQPCRSQAGHILFGRRFRPLGFGIKCRQQVMRPLPVDLLRQKNSARREYPGNFFGVEAGMAI